MLTGELRSDNSGYLGKLHVALKIKQTALNDNKQKIFFLPLGVKWHFLTSDTILMEGGKGANLTPGKLNVKLGLHLACIAVLVYFWFLVGCFCLSFLDTLLLI